MKLTKLQKTLLKRAIDNDGCLALHGRREENAAEVLWADGLLRTVVPGYGWDFVITPDGRDALEGKK